MKLQELIFEETLQGMLKRLFKPAGTIGDVGGKDAANIAKMLQGKTTDAAFVIKSGSPQSNAAIKSVSTSNAADEVDSEEGRGEIKSVRLPGGRRIVSVGTSFLVTTEHHYDTLVEQKQEDEDEEV